MTGLFLDARPGFRAELGSDVTIQSRAAGALNSAPYDDSGKRLCQAIRFGRPVNRYGFSIIDHRFVHR
jgi:hypothetical protein